MSAIDTVINGAMHSYEWREKTLSEQGELAAQARAEIHDHRAVLKAARVASEKATDLGLSYDEFDALADALERVPKA